LPFVIDDSCVIKLNSDYQVNFIEHHSNDAIVLNREVELPPQVGRNIDTPLTNINTSACLDLEAVTKRFHVMGKIWDLK
jgi:hypothetical protein